MKYSLEELYDKLQRYIHWLAHNANRTHDLHILLQPDDLAGELFLEMVSVYRHYEDRDDLDADTMIRIVKKSLDNRMKNLIMFFHVTHRSEDARTLSLDTDREPVDTVNYWMPLIEASELAIGEQYEIPDPQALLESSGRLNEFLRSLTAAERKIVESILCMDERVARQCKLVGTRKAFVYQNGGTVTINFRIVADALHLDRKECQKLWQTIRHKWRKYEHT